MPIGDIHDAIQALTRWELQLAQVREKLQQRDRLGALDLVRLGQIERGLVIDIEHMRSMETTKESR